MAKAQAIPVTNLVLDSENPRIDEGTETPRESIQAMFEAQGDKLVRLAAHIQANGLNPTERFLVMPHQDGRRFTVLEGNRRAAALKLLAEPTILDDSGVKPRQLKELKKLHRAFMKSAIRSVEATVVANRDEADRWIELKHRGELEGAGIVRWGSTEAARFDQRHGRISPELQLIDFATHNAKVDEKTRDRMKKAPLTNVKRLVSDGKVRKALGVEIDANGRITTRFSNETVLRGIVRVLDDLGSKRVKVRDIYTEDNRRIYLATISSELPKRTDATGVSRVLEVQGEDSSDIDSRSGGAKQRANRASRATLAPRTCKLAIGDSRIAKIFAELRTLKVEAYPNASAVLLRVFLELTADHYVEAKKVPFNKDEAAKAGLGHKLTKIARHMQDQGVLTEQQLAGVRKAAVDRAYLSANVVTFHGYVHNKYLNPIPTDLLAGWDNLQLFFETAWAAK